MKIIAWHLPQFHRIKENDIWWGDGFTEWVNVKKTQPHFNGHNQPRQPLNNNYYDMLEHKTMLWQKELSESHGIDGFCYYHYWFNGHKLLEKPVQNLLKWKDIDQKFCLSWANEPWTRAWDGESNEVLMAQSYGSKASWRAHIEYLIPIFSDVRYIKKNGKPVFLIYKAASIPNCDEMIAFFENQCQKAGLDGIYVIETLNLSNQNPTSKRAQACVTMEPSFTLGNSGLDLKDRVLNKIYRLLKNKPTTVSFKGFSKKIIDRSYPDYNKTLNLSSFVDWDNTPRRGGDGLVMSESDPENFKVLLEKQLIKGKQLGSDFHFINAWNEWAEGAYLEPDMNQGTKYLEAVRLISKKHCS